MAAPLILIPPSEGKSSGGSRTPWVNRTRRTSTLDPARREVIAALTAAMHGDLASRTKLLGVGETSTEEATITNLAIDTAPTLPAIERYDGVLYGALDQASLAPAERRRLNAQVLIFSGLWGVIAPDEPIPDYKCKMGASLAPLGKLATWWRPRLAELLEARSAGRTVWNLLPGEHDAAYAPSTTARRVLRVRFLDDVARHGTRELVAVNHWNKLLKGSLVRHLLATQLTGPDGLEAFVHPQGYVYRPDLTESSGKGTTISFVATR